MRKGLSIPFEEEGDRQHYNVSDPTSYGEEDKIHLQEPFETLPSVFDDFV
jgi:hypothetical protein